VTEIVRKGSNTRVSRGDVLRVVIPGDGPPLWIEVWCFKDGRVWGRECSATAAPFGPLLAFRPEDVGCEEIEPNRLLD
jgi:hypothetical protein